jgi:phosphatidylglycerophosphate synthase
MSNQTSVTDRRPLKSRQTTWARGLTGWLVRRRVTPNAISIFGLACGIAGGFVLAAASDTLVGRVSWIGGAALVQLRLLCNLLDGMVAMESGRAGAIGVLYNEVPDRISDSATLIGLGFAAGGAPWLGFVAALAAVFTAYVRAQAAAVGAPQDFCGPLAKPQRMFLVTIVTLYCGLAPIGWQPLLNWPAGGGVAAIALAVILVGSLLTAWRRLVRAARALRGATG